MLPDSLAPALEGVFPLTMITSSADGVPNITNLSRVWTVDAEHIAIAHQMLNKSVRNLDDNPLALFRIIDPADLLNWELEASYVRSESEGPLYRRITEDLQTISWMAGAAEAVPVRAVLIFRVIAASKEEKGPGHVLHEGRHYAELLEAVAEQLEWNVTSLWTPHDGGSTVKLLASRGTAPEGMQASELDAMKRLAALVMSKGTAVRLRNIRSHLRYMQTIRSEIDSPARAEAFPTMSKWAKELKASYLGFPLTASDKTIGVICCEATSDEAEVFNRFDDDLLQLLSRRLGEAAVEAGAMKPEEWKPLFRQTIERSTLEWAKCNDPFHTVLSARERQVAVCVAKGMTNEEIARALFISKRTVTTHLERIYQKLDASSRTVLARYVVEKGFLGDES